MATALITGGGLDAARSALLRVAGTDATAQAVAVAANFEMMNRVLDATGCPVPARARKLEAPLGL